MSTFENSILLGTAVVWSVATALLVQKAALGLLLDVMGAAAGFSGRHVSEADPQGVVGAEEKRLDRLR
jgi:hypothetical protein